MRSLAPILFFAYNRPDHTRQTLEAISKNRLADQSSLFIYIDGAKANATSEQISKIDEVKKIAAEKQWCREVKIICSPVNKGLFHSITGGVNEAMDQFGKVIVVEDDVLVSPGFLEYMNNALDFYEHTDKVMHIAAFSRPDLAGANIPESTYFFYHTTCWGWGTWKRAWSKFVPDHMAVKKKLSAKGNISKVNLDNTHEFFWGLKAIAQGKFHGWNAIWHSTVFLNDGLCLHPLKSLVKNIGHDGSGIICKVDDIFVIEDELADKIPVTPIPLEENKMVRNYYKKLYPFKYKLVFVAKHYLRYLMR